MCPKHLLCVRKRNVGIHTSQILSSVKLKTQISKQMMTRPRVWRGEVEGSTESQQGGWGLSCPYSGHTLQGAGCIQKAGHCHFKHVPGIVLIF